jgi:hypothetical protein
LISVGRMAQGGEWSRFRRQDNYSSLLEKNSPDISLFYSEGNYSFRAVLPEAGASEASFSKNPRKRSVREASVIYTYNFLYILHFYSKKYVERQISCRIYENMHICTSI